MLTDTKLRALKATGKLYKVGRRQETMTFGIYGPSGITLAEARETQMRHRHRRTDPPPARCALVGQIEVSA
ncbi:hypothetical protein D3C78_08410 [compost metagenome]